MLVKALQGLGSLASGEDLAFEYAGSLNQEGNLTAGRDLNLSVGGHMSNRARVSAAVTEHPGGFAGQPGHGELLAGRNNTIDVSRGLSNDGLIDGQYTRISAASLSNRGRIYGDTVAIRAASSSIPQAHRVGR